MKNLENQNIDVLPKGEDLDVVFNFFGYFLFLGTDLVNPEDPNVIAENELLGATSAIEAAARKLAELKPRERPRVTSIIFFFICFIILFIYEFLPNVTFSAFSFCQ